MPDALRQIHCRTQAWMKACFFGEAELIGIDHYSSANEGRLWQIVAGRRRHEQASVARDVKRNTAGHFWLSFLLRADVFETIVLGCRKNTF